MVNRIKSFDETIFTCENSRHEKSLRSAAATHSIFLDRSGYTA